MTTAELIAILVHEYPNGISFDPMALRLLRKKVFFEDRQVDYLKEAMFQLGNGLWFYGNMILDDENRKAFEEQATEWLNDYCCFSVERLFKDFRGVIHHIATTEDCATFLMHLGFKVTVWGKEGHFCSLSPFNMNDNLAKISETIAGRLEEAGGTLPFNEIEQAMPHLTTEALEDIRVNFLMEVYEVEVGGVQCWRSITSVTLPEDFSVKLTDIVDTLVDIDEKMTVTKLGFALNLFYRARFREEYTLLDNDTFMRVCATHYQGRNDVFPNTKKTRVRDNDLSAPSKRMRSPNTRFSNLCVPVGAKLVFTKNLRISCFVLDNVNQVQYDGKTWSISKLANHLLGVSSINGYCNFSYEGETLWERRLRLEKLGTQIEYQAALMSTPSKEQDLE